MKYSGEKIRKNVIVLKNSAAVESAVKYSGEKIRKNVIVSEKNIAAVESAVPSPAAW